MNKLITISIILMSIQIATNAQDLSEFMSLVARQNPEIIAYRKLLEARKIEAKTGLTPSDPTVSIGYMPGITSNSGIKRTWSVNQSFSFPTKYLVQLNLSRSHVILAEQEFNLILLNKLFETKTLLFDLIYNEKSLEVLRKRKEAYDKLKSAMQTMLEKGETTVLDFNKIILELSSLEVRMRATASEIFMIRGRLDYLSGNSSKVPVNSEYPVFIVPGLDSLLSTKENLHPAFLLPETEYRVMVQEVKMSRTGSLPEFHAGYGSEMVPGENFTGPVAGISVPLWSNANRVKASKAMAAQSEAARDAELLGLRSQVQAVYEKMNSLKKSISEIKPISGNEKNLLLLEKALSSGEISFYTYFQYLETEYEVTDQLLVLENEYNKTLCRLFDHELLR